MPEPQSHCFCAGPFAGVIARSRDDYLALVDRLAQDASWRESLRQQLRNAQGELFGRADALQHLFAFFEREAATAV